MEYKDILKIWELALMTINAAPNDREMKEICLDIIVRCSETLYDEYKAKTASNRIIYKIIP